MSDFQVIVADGPVRDERMVTVGTTLADLFTSGDLGRGAGDRSVVAARITDGAGTRLVDLAVLAKAGDVVEPVAADSEDGRAIVRHSTAHVLAQAVSRSSPKPSSASVRRSATASTTTSTSPKPFHPDDLKALESRMQAIIKQGQLFSRRAVTDDAAREELASEPYKLELIGLKGKASAGRRRGRRRRGRRGELTIYDNLDAKTGDLCWKDLCRGPHVPNTRSSRPSS